MSELYDEIGKGYSAGRTTDPKIAAQIIGHLDGADSILNIGAGSGSYEPPGRNLIALEPSTEMIKQRPLDSHPVVRSAAESLPFGDKKFSHTMTVLSIHHWHHRTKAFEEINRVTQNYFIAVTWDPAAAPFWLTRDYFPEIYEADLKAFPYVSELRGIFFRVDVHPLLIPSDCIDGFLAAYWSRPHAYLDENVRKRISTFSRIENPAEGISKLSKDLSSGEWHSKYGHLKTLNYLDAGYRVAVCKIH